MENMKYVLIGFKKYKVNEEEFDHYHIDGYPLPVNKIDTITLIPKFLGQFSERRHMKNLKKGRRYRSRKYISQEEIAKRRKELLARPLP